MGSFFFRARLVGGRDFFLLEGDESGVAASMREWGVGDRIFHHMYLLCHNKLLDDRGTEAWKNSFFFNKCAWYSPFFPHENRVENCDCRAPDAIILIFLPRKKGPYIYLFEKI